MPKDTDQLAKPREERDDPKNLPKGAKFGDTVVEGAPGLDQNGNPVESEDPELEEAS